MEYENEVKINSKFIFSVSKEDMRKVEIQKFLINKEKIERKKECLKQ